MKFYDVKNNRLVYVSSKANDEYWDSHWDSEKNFKQAIQRKFDPFVVGNTKKYLKKGDKILEGGCGIGQNVYLLDHHGFDTVGVDYAQNTVDKINAYAPELDVIHGDVRSLPFENNFFDGYWSFGVIEHFYNGYDEIMNEMYRVLKLNGVLLMTVPTMSPLRKLKAKLRKYPLWDGKPSDIENFYQFALDSNSIVKHYERNGFKLLESRSCSGFKGLKDEVNMIKGPMQYIFDSPSILNRIIKTIIGKIFEKFSGHMTLFIFKKVVCE